MAVLTVVEPTIDGNDPLYVAAAGGGDEFAVDDDTVFHVRNGSGVSVNVTLTSTAGTEPGIAAANKVVAVPAGANRDIRVKPAGRFKNANGRCAVTYSAVTTVTVAVTRVA